MTCRTIRSAESRCRHLLSAVDTVCACQAGMGPPLNLIYLFKIQAFMIPVAWLAFCAFKCYNSAVELIFISLLSSKSNRIYKMVAFFEYFLSLWYYKPYGHIVFRILHAIWDFGCSAVVGAQRKLIRKNWTIQSGQSPSIRSNCSRKLFHLGKIQTAIPRLAMTIESS